MSNLVLYIPSVLIQPALCGAVIGATDHNRLVRVAIEVFHQHFITDSRYHLAAVVRTGKIL